MPCGLSSTGDFFPMIIALLQWVILMLEMLVPLLHVVVVALLLLLTGFAVSVSWIYVPVLVDPVVAPQATLVHFRRVVNGAFRQLRFVERMLVVGNMVMVFASYRNSDALIHWRWPYHLASGMVLAQMLWYDMLFILPIEDEVLNLDGNGEEEERDEDACRLKKIKGKWEVALLVQKWEMVHRMRIAFPAFAAIISLSALAGD